MTPTSIPVVTFSPVSTDGAGTIAGFLAGSFILVGLAFIFWLLSLVDILKSEFKEPNNKVVWLIVTFLLPVLGPILYFLIGRKQLRKGSGISLKVFSTIILFFIWYPLAIVLMWFWTNWPKWTKIVITIVGILLFSFSMWGKYLSPYK